ncbi:hypothetical protein AgCh_000128 [Apium graveolens]
MEGGRSHVSARKPQGRFPKSLLKYRSLVLCCFKTGSALGLNSPIDYELSRACRELNEVEIVLLTVEDMKI